MHALTAPTLLFDGVCNVCNAAVQFTLDHEADHDLVFTSLQSDAGARLLTAHGKKALAEGEDPDTVIIVEGDQLYDRSDAVFRLAAHLRAPWRWVRVFRIVPRPVRDVFYRLFARNRYRLFGKSDSCRLPTPELQARFVEA